MMAEASIFGGLAESDLLTKRFDFRTHCCASFPHEAGTALVEESFRAVRRGTSIDISSLAGAEPKADWVSPGPTGSVALQLEPGLVKVIASTADFKDAERIWLANMFPDSEPLLMRAKTGETTFGPWYLVLGTCKGRAVCGWPVLKAFDSISHEFFEIDCKAERKYFYPYHLDFELLSGVWSSPWQQIVLHKASTEQALRPARLRLSCVGPPEKLKTAAARECFWTTSITDVRRFADLLDAPNEIMTKHTEAEFLELFVRWLLPGLSDTEIYMILIKRAQKDTLLEELWRTTS